MFARNALIEEAHRPVLESTIRNHAGITEPYLAKLYESAAKLFLDNDPAHLASGLSSAWFSDEKSTIVSVTDIATGVYLQLTGASKANSNRQLTVGQKWVMQGKHGSHQHGAVKLW